MRWTVCGDVACDLINTPKCSLGPLGQHRSSAVSGENRFDLLIGGQFASIGFLDALMNVTNLPGLTLNIVGQRFDG